MDEVVALGVPDTAVALGVAPVIREFVHADKRDGHGEGGVEERAVVIGEEFVIFVGLGLDRSDRADEFRVRGGAW